MPIDAEALSARLLAPAGRYAAVDVVASTGSTNTDLVTAGRAGAADLTVLIAEQQTAGQGRQRRAWVSPPESGLYVSVLVRPTGIPRARLGWLTLLAGVAAARTATWAGAPAALKWPNDLLLGPDQRKAAGILAEVASVKDPAVVVGIGLNVLPLPADVPLGPGSLPGTSLADQGATVLDRTELAAHLLTGFADLLDTWRAAAGDPAAGGLAAEYRRWCVTLGRRVRVELPGPAELVGRADDVDADGTLLVRTDDDRTHEVSAGDVVHLRVQP